MTSDERRAWLEGLREGDNAGDAHPDCPNSATVCVVIGVGPRTITLDNGKRFDRATGVCRDNKIRQIIPISAALQERIDRETLCNKIKNDKLPITTVRKILDLLAEVEQTKEST